MKTCIIAFGLLIICTVFVSSCTTSLPKITKVNGKTLVQTDKKFLGIPVTTKTEEVKTKDQKLDDLEVQKETREQELDLKAEERQSAAAFWIGLVLLIAGPICVIIGYMSNGWKFWGAMGALCVAVGIAFWSFEHLIPYLKWIAFSLPIVIVLWTMYKLKDFSLLDKLRNSEPGKIL